MVQIKLGRFVDTDAGSDYLDKITNEFGVYSVSGPRSSATIREARLLVNMNPLVSSFLFVPDSLEVRSLFDSSAQVIALKKLSKRFACGFAVIK